MASGSMKRARGGRPADLVRTGLVYDFGGFVERYFHMR